MKRPNRKHYINKDTKTQLIADQELYIDYLEAEIKKLRIDGVIQSLPKRLSNAAYLNAREMKYKEFVAWWDEQ